MDVGERIAVILSHHIQAPVVPTRPPRTISFWHNVQRGGPGGIRAPDDPHLFHLKKLRFGHLEFLSIQSAWTRVNRWAFSGDEMFYFMSHFSFKILHQQVWKALQEGFVWPRGGEPQTGDRRWIGRSSGKGDPRSTGH